MKIIVYSLLAVLIIIFFFQKKKERKKDSTSIGYLNKPCLLFHCFHANVRHYVGLCEVFISVFYSCK